MRPLSFQEFDESGESALEQAMARRRRRVRNAALIGAVTGLFAVLVTDGFTHRELGWRSFVFEPVFCGAAGFMVARLGGGFFKGFGFFFAAYLAAFLLQGTTLDINMVFSEGETQGRAAMQGTFMSFSIVMLAGGILGHMHSQTESS